MTLTHSIIGSIDPVINGLLYGTAWDGPITYAFPTSASAYTYGPEAANGFAPLTTQQQTAAIFAFNSVSRFTDLDIIQGDQSSAIIRAAQSNTPSTAYSYMPSEYTQGGDVWTGAAVTSPQAGNYAWHTFLHEIGHALGLKHGHEANPLFPTMPAAYDSLEYSVMTYRSYIGGSASAYNYGIWSAPQTYMMADIAALQYMYGADYTVNSDDTVYKWNPNNGNTRVDGSLWLNAGGSVIFATIWDGNGVDTYDLSAYTTDLRIDLRPGSSSTFNAAQLANLGNAHKASGNIYNAFLHDADERSLIENAIGGNGDDRFRGNAEDNTFTGGKGADRFVIGTNEGYDVITDFNPNKDVIVFNGERLSIHDDGRSMVSLDFGQGQMVDIWF